MCVRTFGASHFRVPAGHDQPVVRQHDFLVQITPPCRDAARRLPRGRGVASQLWWSQAQECRSHVEVWSQYQSVRQSAGVRRNPGDPSSLKGWVGGRRLGPKLPKPTGQCSSNRLVRGNYFSSPTRPEFPDEMGPGFARRDRSPKCYARPYGVKRGRCDGSATRCKGRPTGRTTCCLISAGSRSDTFLPAAFRGGGVCGSSLSGCLVPLFQKNEVPPRASRCLPQWSEWVLLYLCFHRGAPGYVLTPLYP